MNNQIVKINNTDLSVKEFNGQRVVTFKDIDMLHERVEGTAKRNFADNKKHFIENVDYFELSKNDVGTDFVLTYGFDKKAPKGLLITESGYLMLVKSLQDDLAWKVQRELVNNYFRVKEIVQARPLSPEEILEQQFKFTKEVKEKVEKVDSRVTLLEERMTIETGAQKTLKDLVEKKVVAILGGKDSPAYAELGKKAFMQCWKNFKDILQVASYKDTPVKDFDLAKQIIIDWQPNRELQLMIRGCNAQIRM